jgi:hypothetical protein
MTQCLRDTEGSGRHALLDGSRPTDHSSSVKAKTVPLDAPAITINLGFISALNVQAAPPADNPTNERPLD